MINRWGNINSNMPTTKKAKTTKTSAPDYKIILEEVLDLSSALVREIDNIMESQLPPAQVGKVLGDVVSGFQQRLEEYKVSAKL